MLFRRAQATSLFHHIIRGRPSSVVSDPWVELFMIEGCLIVAATLVPRKNMSKTMMEICVKMAETNEKQKKMIWIMV